MLELVTIPWKSCPAWLLIPVAAGALAILSIGISRDYRLKHENNNAIYTTFARSHLQLGLGVTRGHDMFVDRETGNHAFYGHHPPGIALVLASAFWLAGDDGPRTTRTVAITFTLVALVLLSLLARRELGPCAGLMAAGVFAILPQSAFYGRMINHEILALPAMIVVVGSYLDFGRSGRARSAFWLVLASTLGALMAWATFFVLAACGAHALTRRREKRFPVAFRVLIALSACLMMVNVAHIFLVKRGLADLGEIFSRRIGTGADYGLFDWLFKMSSFSLRLFTATGTVALIWWVARTVRGWLGGREPRWIEEFGLVFTLAGGAYLAVFNHGAWQHHYWQYPLAPAVVIATVIAIQTLTEKARLRGRPWKVLLVVALVELVTFSVLGLYKRHTRVDAFVVERVAELRAQHL